MPSFTATSDNNNKAPSPNSPADFRVEMGLEFVKASRDEPQTAFLGDILSSKISMSPDNYRDLIERIKKDPDMVLRWEGQIRHDYNPSTGTLTLDRTTKFHEMLVRKVLDNIADQARKISTDSAQPAHIRQIARSTLAFSPYHCGVLMPGCFFAGQIPSRKPHGLLGIGMYVGIVIEIAYDQQSERELRDIASQYIHGSQGAVNVVLAISLPCRLGPATVHEWRSSMVKDAQGRKRLQMYQIEPKEFRKSGDEPGKEDGQVYLTLQDLLPHNGRDRVPKLPITIDLNDLASYVTCAENEYLGFKDERHR